MSAPRAWLALLLALGLQSPLAHATAPRVEWNESWPRFRASEAALTGAMLLPLAGAVFLYPKPDANLRGGFLFDNAIRDALVQGSRSGRDLAARWSTYPYWGLLAFPVLIDTALVTAGAHGSGDVALEMLAMNLESFAITGGIAVSFQKLGRVRPAEKGCRTDPSYSGKCDDPAGLNQSFMSGHTAIAFTGAGLTCAHHRNLPLYGGGAPDLAICLVTLAAASSTGVLRLLSDNHYASDVLLGAGLGIASGYLLPEWLHYTRDGGLKSSGGLLPTFRSSDSRWMAVLAPHLGPDYTGVTLLGLY